MVLMVKNYVKRLLPSKLRILIKKEFKFYSAIREYYYDMDRYLTYSSTIGIFGKNKFEKLEARIMAHIHSIERALSLKETRIGFGKSLILSLLDLLNEYIKSGFDTNNRIFLLAISTINAYIKFHQEKNFNVDWVKEKVKKFERFVNQDNLSKVKGGYLNVSRDEIVEASKKDFRVFSSHRFSIRNFTEEEVDINIILEAIKIAQKYPSVCNRQPGQVHIIKDKNTLKKIIDWHNGVRGFDYLINTLLVVTSDLSCFFDINERYQHYIDGGIFLMSLLYGLHYVNLGACPLNNSVESIKDKEIREILNIKPWETIIAFVAVGHLPERFRVAISSRRNIEQIVSNSKKYEN